jgi:MoxR-like ATPase
VGHPAKSMALGGGILLTQPSKAGRIGVGDTDDVAVTLRDLLREIAEKYDRTQGTASEAQELLRRVSKSVISPVLSDKYIVEGSGGRGAAAHVPWISVFNPAETTTAQRGIYVVYLFKADMTQVYLSLNQGVTDLVEQHGPTVAREMLTGQAAQIRAAMPELAGYLARIALGSAAPLPRNYEAGNIAAISYDTAQLPTNEELVRDLRNFLRFYDDALVARDEVEPASPTKHAWIFQARPGVWDLRSYLKDPATHVGSVDEWALRQHVSQISDGDTVFLWSAGESAGIYATGTVVGASFERPRQAWEGHDAPESSPAIRYRLDRILLDNPLLRVDLLEHPVLKDLSVIRQPAGTNFPVTQEQWRALQLLLDKDSQPDPMLTVEWLSKKTFWSTEQLNEVIEAVERKKQVVLSGPPGTGKTWVAKHMASYLTGGRTNAVHVVQFHPTYAYEDFVEGLRPVAHEGNVIFDVVPGKLIRVAEQARHATHPVVLVIDEFNRANIPSVFGELLYLLEYRDERIGLLHRSEFSLPENLYIIATMNTADRSIRTVDTALRRRFEIFDCPPRPDVIDAYYAADNRSEIIDLVLGMAHLNQRLTDDLDRHHTIGHSFFMETNFGAQELRRNWDRQIRPLIDEYFFDQPDVANMYTLEAFWPGTAY